MVSKKSTWQKNKKQDSPRLNNTFWIFGLHAVRDALRNPKREKMRLLVTKNALQKLTLEIAEAHIEPEIVDPRKLPSVFDLDSVHQGAMLEVRPLNWESLESILTPIYPTDRIILLDRINDPQNVGAILRSAHVFGARAVIAPERYAVRETGALAKSASGALEKQPYLCIRNLGETIVKLKNLGYLCLGLDETGSESLHDFTHYMLDQPVAFILGSEGSGLRMRTKLLCDKLVHIATNNNFTSLNVSNAAAIALYTLTFKGKSNF